MIILCANIYNRNFNTKRIKVSIMIIIVIYYHLRDLISNWPNIQWDFQGALLQLQPFLVEQEEQQFDQDMLE